MRRRKVPLMLLEMVLSDRALVISQGHSGRDVYMARVDITEGKQAVMRVVVEPGDPLVVVTVYYSTKLGKYWRDPDP